VPTDRRSEKWSPALRKSARFALLAINRCSAPFNEKLETLNEAFENLTGSGTIACECADITCVEMLDVEPREYDAVRAEPRHFIVVSGHVYPDVERVVRQFSPREGSPQPARTSTLAALPILRPALETSITLTLTFHIVRSR